MEKQQWVQTLGLIASVVLPLWNIPLILRIRERKSSRDVSLSWALGVWFCLILLFPSAWVSPDLVWKVYNIINFGLFSAVVVTVLIYHKEPKKNL